QQSSSTAGRRTRRRRALSPQTPPRTGRLLTCPEEAPQPERRRSARRAPPTNASSLAETARPSERRSRPAQLAVEGAAVSCSAVQRAGAATAKIRRARSGGRGASLCASSEASCPWFDLERIGPVPVPGAEPRKGELRGQRDHRVADEQADVGDVLLQAVH